MAAAEGVLQTVLAGAVRGGMQLDGDRLAVVVRGQLQDGGRDGDEQAGVHVREGEQPPLLLRPARARDARGQRGAAVAVVRQVTLQLRAVVAGPDVGHLRQVVEVLRPRLLLEVRAVLKQAELALLAADQVVAEVLRAQVRPLGHHLHLHARRSLRQQLVEVVLHLLRGGKAAGVDVVVIGLDHAVFGAVYLLDGHGSGQNWSVCGVPVVIKHGGCARAALRHQSRAYGPLIEQGQVVSRLTKSP